MSTAWWHVTFQNSVNLKHVIHFFNYNFICICICICICISYAYETYLDVSVMHNNENLQLDGYSLIRSDHPSYSKRGGVCLYYKESLGVKIINLSACNECILCEVLIENCNGFIAVIYRSPGQNNGQFENFLSLFEDLINEITPSNPLFYLIQGDFNAQSPNWWNDDKISIEGARLEALSSFSGLHQLIKEPTHSMKNSASCIDLIFTNQPNLVIDSGVHPSLHISCHRQIVYCKLNLSIKFPPPYERLVWDYNKADTEKIKKFIEQVHWGNIFNHKKSPSTGSNFQQNYY